MTRRLALAVGLIAGLLVAPPAAWSQDRYLVHVDGAAAREEAWARRAAELVAATVNGLTEVTRLERRLRGDTRGLPAPWELIVQVGARDDDRPRQIRRFGASEGPVNVEELARFLQTADAARDAWRGAFAVPEFVKSQGRSPVVVVRLVPADRADKRSAMLLASSERLASAPDGLPRRMAGYAPVAWGELPARVAAVAAARWPVDLGQCRQPCSTVEQVQVWLVVPGDLTPEQAVVMPPAAGQVSWLATADRGVFQSPVRQLDTLGDLPISASDGARLACVFLPSRGSLVLDQDQQPRTSVLAQREVRVRLRGGGLAWPDAWTLVVSEGQQPRRDLCASSELLTEEGCRWRPRAAGSATLELVGLDPRCAQLAGAVAATVDVRAGRPVEVTGHFSAAACPGEPLVSFGESVFLRLPSRICVGHALHFSHGLTGEARRRALERVSLELRSGLQVVGLAHPEALEGIAVFPFEVSMSNRPLYVAFRLQDQEPIDVGDDQYLLKAGSLPPSGSLTVRSAVDHWGSTAIAGVLAIVFAALLGWGVYRWEQRREHLVKVVFQHEGFVDTWRAPVRRTAAVFATASKDGAERDLPPILRLRAIAVRRTGRTYEVELVKETREREIRRGCRPGQIHPWGPFAFYLERWRQGA